MLKEYFKELKNLEIYETEHGFILYRIQNENQLYIRDVYVSPKFRNSGIAFKMADTLIEMAKNEYDCEILLGDVEPSNNNATASIKFLLAYGMQVVEANDDEIIFGKQI